VFKMTSGSTEAKTINKEHLNWLPSYIADKLFLEMCESTRTIKVLENTHQEQEINWYYAEADRYTRLMAFGNFEGKNKKLKPIFRLDCKDFSAELKDALKDRLKTSKGSLHRVIQEGVFKLIRARHKMMFYEHVEPEPLRWVFV
jgi:hypothetical protein